MNIAETISRMASALTPLEIAVFISGALCVFLVVQRSIWNFPVGLLNSSLCAVLFFGSRLYWDVLLQAVFFVLGVLGWMWWARGVDANQSLPIRRADAEVLLRCVLLITIALPFMTAASHQFGGAAPFWDSLTTALSLVAQFLLGRKILQNWWFWIVADCIYIPLYISRELYLVAALYVLFLLLCIAGLRAWKRELNTQTA